MEKFNRQLQFHHSVTVDPIGIADGLVVLWNDGVEVGVEIAQGILVMVAEVQCI